MRGPLDVYRRHTSGVENPYWRCRLLNVWRADHRVNQRFPEPRRRSPYDVIAGNRPTETLS